MTSAGPIPLRHYSDGGIASSPQLAMFGEGSGPEAYVPLKNGGIPVHVKGGAAGVPQTTVIQGGDLHVHGNVTEDVLPKMQAMLAESNREMQANIQRNMGQMSAKWNQRYGN